MSDFNKAYTELLEDIERDLYSPLTIGEKLSIKECLKYSQEVCMKRSLDDMVGGLQMQFASDMFFMQLGIDPVAYSFYTLREDLRPDLIKYINHARDMSLLL